MRRFRGSLGLVLVGIALQVLFTFYPDFIEMFALHVDMSLEMLPGLITHMISHASWGHLLGNYSFGLPYMLWLERRMGYKRFLEYFVSCGLFACLVQVLLGGSGGMIGSSGAIAGCFAGACIRFGRTPLEKGIAKLIFFNFMLAQLAMAPMGAMMGIAFYAHVGGALGGLILSSYPYFREVYAHKRP